MLCPQSCADPNYTESVSGGAELILAILPRSEAVTLTTMDARLPLDAFEVRYGLTNRVVQGALIVSTRPSLFTCMQSLTLFLLVYAMQPMLELGTAGCRQIFDIMQSTVKEQTANRLASRGTITS